MESEIDKKYWEREKKANFTRKKPLDNLEYITIPESLLSMTPENTNEEINQYLQDLKDISSEKIVNLTGYTNTDLKLEYGTANITILSDYDIHYTNLVTLLQKIAELLNQNGDKKLAVEVLEFAVDTKTDISKSYYLLADLYKEMGTPEKISTLIDKAQNIKSLLKDTIIENLRKDCYTSS
jgi:tetratricopeptide (TPR) repeat protein